MNASQGAETEAQAGVKQRLLNASISSHLWIGSNLNQQNKQQRVISYAVMAALEVAIAENGGQLAGDSFESLAAKDRLAQEEVAILLEEMKKAPDKRSL